MTKRRKPARPSPSERRIRFVEAYVGPAAGNAAEAARLAGYSCKTAHAASVVGNRLLADVAIQAAVERARAERRAASLMDALEQEQLLAKIARGEIADVHLVKRGPGPAQPEERDVPVSGRLAAIDQLAKRQGAYVSKHEISGPDGGPIRVETWAERLRRKAAQYAAGETKK